MSSSDSGQSSSTYSRSLKLRNLEVHGKPHCTATSYNVRVLSDLHLDAPGGAQRTLPDDFRNLCNLLLDEAEQFDVLVLNGDIYETWMIPITHSHQQYDVHGLMTELKQADTDSYHLRAAVHSYLEANARTDQQQIKCFHRVLAHIHYHRQQAVDRKLLIYFTMGNHDSFVQDEWLPWFITPLTAANQAYYYHDRVLIEHGHRYDLFNRPPSSQYHTGCYAPIGYFISRVAASVNYKEGTPSLIQDAANWLIKNGTSFALHRFSQQFQGWLKWLFQKVVAASNTPEQRDIEWWLDQPFCGYYEHVKHLCGDAEAAEVDQLRNYTLKQMLDDYSRFVVALLDNIDETARKSALSKEVVAMMLLAALGDYEPWKNCWDQHRDMSYPTDIVVLGHTHTEEMEKSKRKVVYSNSGTWTTPGRSTYIDVHVRERIPRYTLLLSFAQGVCELKNCTQQRSTFQTNLNPIERVMARFGSTAKRGKVVFEGAADSLSIEADETEDGTAAPLSNNDWEPVKGDASLDFDTTKPAIGSSGF